MKDLREARGGEKYSRKHNNEKFYNV